MSDNPNVAVLPAKWLQESEGFSDGDAMARRACARELQAALSARDEAGADALHGWPKEAACCPEVGTYACRCNSFRATPPAASGDESEPGPLAFLRDMRNELALSRPTPRNQWRQEALEWAIRRLAAVAPAGMDGWQPIETAPKDGTRVLTCHYRGGYACDYQINHWNDPSRTTMPLGRLGWWCSPPHRLPTHWLPLTTPGAAPTQPATAGKE